MESHKDRILWLLKTVCSGRGSASKSGELTGMTGIDDREVREIIRELRREGHPIGSGPRGFWWINEPEEHRQFLDSLKGRAFDILRTVSIQAHIPAAELAGQLKIELEGENADTREHH
jgi:hypothetical protein